MTDEALISIEYEQLDNVTIFTIFPTCFVCRHKFYADEVAVRMRVQTQLTMRFHVETCWEYFKVCIEIFEELKHTFKPTKDYLT